MDKFKNKYRIPPARAQWWNYGWDAAYYVTICTRGRRKVFGEICNEQAILSALGLIADECWREIPDHARNIELGVHVVMPNHVHGILILEGNEEPQTAANSAVGQSRFQHPGRNTISTILGGYKSAVSRSARRAGYDFGWQSRFHDHIIRDEEEFYRISDYILDNPANWENDKFFLP